MWLIFYFINEHGVGSRQTAVKNGRLPFCYLLEKEKLIIVSIKFYFRNRIVANEPRKGSNNKMIRSCVKEIKAKRLEVGNRCE